MNKFNWEQLNTQQLGAYAEYYVKMEFTMYGFHVFTPEVDDRGVDMITRFDKGPWLEVQIKSLFKADYIFMRKDRFIPSSTLLAAVVLFVQGKAPDLYLIPSTEWQTPNVLLKDRDKSSYQEWGINLSKKNRPMLKSYFFDTIVQKLAQTGSNI